MHGKGLFTWSNGHTYKGGFNNDMKEGKFPWAICTAWYHFPPLTNVLSLPRVPTTTPVLSLLPRVALITGKGCEKWSNGDSYIGDFHKDKKHGRGMYKWADGRIYDGDFRDNKMHGKGVYKWPNKGEYLSTNDQSSLPFTVPSLLLWQSNPLPINNLNRIKK